MYNLVIPIGNFLASGGQRHYSNNMLTHNGFGQQSKCFIHKNSEKFSTIGQEFEVDLGANVLSKIGFTIYSVVP